VRIAREHASVSVNSDELLSNLRLFATDVVPKLCRPAAQAAAQVFYDEVRSRVAALGDKPEQAAAEAGVSVGTGNLLRAIYQAHSEDKSVNGKQAYVISWRTGKVKKDKRDKQVQGGLTIAPHGFLVEFGHWRKYKVYKRNGRWFTRVRPEAIGLKVKYIGQGRFRMVKIPGATRMEKPNHKMGDDVMSKYFDKLPDAKRVPGKAFIRLSYEAKKNAALQAMIARMRADFPKAVAGQL